MIRTAIAEDREIFSVLWAEFLRDAHKEGSDMLPTPRNLVTLLKVFDAYVSGLLDGVVKIAEEDGEIIGAMMAGEASDPQTFDSSLGRIATAWGHYVREPHRGKGWALKMNQAAMEDVRLFGFDVAIGPVLEKNIGSTKTSLRVGAEPICPVMMLRLGGM